MLGSGIRFAASAAGRVCLEFRELGTRTSCPRSALAPAGLAAHRCCPSLVTVCLLVFWHRERRLAGDVHARSKTACSGSNAPPGSSRPRSPCPRPPIAPASARATSCSPSMASRSKRRGQVLAVQQRAKPDDRHVYTLLRLGSREVAQVQLAPLPDGAGLLYYLLAGVGIFTLLVGAAVRARRPGDQATLHFFWLRGGVLRRAGVLVQRTARQGGLGLLLGRRRRAAAAAAAVPALRAGVPGAAAPARATRRCSRAGCRPSTCRPRCSASRACWRWSAPRSTPTISCGWSALLDRLELLYLAGFLTAGLVVLVRALIRTRCVTVKRQLRWIVWGTALGAMPFALGYAVPFALRRRAVAADGAVGRPARVHSGGLRLGHRPLPADGRRDHPQAPARLHLRGRRQRRASSCSSSRPPAARSSRASRISGG